MQPQVSDLSVEQLKLFSFLAAAQARRGRTSVAADIEMCASSQNVGGVQAEITSQGLAPTQRKRCGLRLSK